MTRGPAQHGRRAPSRAIGAAALASVAAHALVALACVVTWRRLPAMPPEVPARIEVVFGKGALTEGAPASAAPAQPAPTPAPQASASAPPAEPTPPEPTPAEPTPPEPTPAEPTPAAIPQASATPTEGRDTPAPSLAPVRLGEGKMGFDVPQPDADLVEAQADPGNRPPRFPVSAEARGEHGTSVLGIHIDTEGRVSRIDLIQSSGYPDLDAAARAAALRWHFIPQLRGGEAVPSYREQAIDFLN